MILARGRVWASPPPQTLDKALCKRWPLHLLTGGDSGQTGSLEAQKICVEIYVSKVQGSLLEGVGSSLFLPAPLVVKVVWCAGPGTFHTPHRLLVFSSKECLHVSEC